MLLGETLALLAAFTWAASVILFKRSEAISPQGINLFKNVTAVILMAITMAAMGSTIDWDRSAEDWWRLSISGVLGITIADTFFFMALRRLGAGLLSIVNCVYAPFIVGLSVLLLDETLGNGFLVGAVLVVGGVLWANTDKTLHENVAPPGSKDRLMGIIIAVSGIALMAVGVVLAKPALERGGLVEVSLIRLVAGVLGQLVWILLVRSERTALHVFKPQGVWRTLFPAAFLGGYVSILLWIGGFKWADASVASVLNELSVVFIVVLASIFLRERITRRRAIGGLVAMVGGALVMIL
jgi:drug/metabolite transporter (DMT)-like permease